MLLALPVTACRAEDSQRIDTDGPDFVESSAAVGAGHYQFETGPTFQRDTRGGADVHTTSGALLLKYGLSRNVEARLETDSLTLTAGTPPSDSPDTAHAGLADTALGLNWHALDADPAHGIPSVAWLLHVELPTGTPRYRGIGARPFLRSVLSWDLPADFTLGVMPGIEYDTRADGHRYTSGIFGIVFGRWWTPRFRTFIEGSAPQIAAAEDGGTLLYKDAGAAFLITDSWQVGGRIGWAANRNTPSRYVLLSLAARF